MKFISTTCSIEACDLHEDKVGLWNLHENLCSGSRRFTSPWVCTKTDIWYSIIKNPCGTTYLTFCLFALKLSRNSLLISSSNSVSKRNFLVSTPRQFRMTSLKRLLPHLECAWRTLLSAAFLLLLSLKLCLFFFKLLNQCGTRSAWYSLSGDYLEQWYPETVSWSL